MIFLYEFTIFKFTFVNFNLVLVSLTTQDHLQFGLKCDTTAKRLTHKRASSLCG